MRLNGGIRPGWDQFGSMHAIKKTMVQCTLDVQRERERTVEMGKIKERKGEKFRERGTDRRKERESKSERGRDNEEKQIERQINRQKHRKKEKNNLMRKPLDVESSGNRKKPPMI